MRARSRYRFAFALMLASAAIVALPVVAKGTTLAKVRSELQAWHLQPPPLFPTRLPASFGGVRVSLSREFDFDVTWSQITSTSELLVSFRRGDSSNLDALLNDQSVVAVHQVQLGTRTVDSIVGDKSVLAWQEQGRTYWLVDKHDDEATALRRLAPFIESLQPLLPPPNGAYYVALGDSYSAGEGVDPYFRDGYRHGTKPGNVDNRCHRSTRAYAEQIKPPGYPAAIYALASKTEKRGSGKRVNKYGSDQNVRFSRKGSWAFLACSGARMINVLRAGKGGHVQTDPGDREAATQLDYSAIGTSTKLVTITIGGNDAGFADVLFHCSIHSCSDSAYRSQLLSHISSLEHGLQTVYAAIRLKAPGARILVLGYPQLFPKSQAEQRCGKLRPWHGEQDMLRAAVTQMNATIEAAAVAEHVEYVDVTHEFAGHEVCGSRGEWINGPSVTWKVDRKFVDDESFHPTLRGQQAYATVANHALAH